jgi:hypothetical protein
MPARRLLIAVGLLTFLACGRAPTRQQTTIPEQTTTPERADQEQRQRNQATIADFAKNWRQQFISQSPDLALPVRRPERPVKEAWQPQVISQCVMVPGAVVPEVTVIWSEPIQTAPPLGVAAQTQRALPVPRVRFDLSLHYDGLRRNYFSAAMPGNRNEPFRLPSTSALVNDQPAVLVTGPGLFPKLYNYAVVPVQDPATRSTIAQHTLVLRELSHGLTYNLALDRPAANGWNEQGRVAFPTPLCPNGF